VNKQLRGQPLCSFLQPPVTPLQPTLWGTTKPLVPYIHATFKAANSRRSGLPGVRSWRSWFIFSQSHESFRHLPQLDSRILTWRHARNAELENAPNIFPHISACPSVRLSACYNQRFAGRIFIKSDTGYLGNQTEHSVIYIHRRANKCIWLIPFNHTSNLVLLRASAVYCNLQEALVYTLTL
jgi:hypothetical protein